MPFYHVRIFVEKEEPLQHLYPIVYRDNYELYATSVYGHSAWWTASLGDFSDQLVSAPESQQPIPTTALHYAHNIRQKNSYGDAAYQLSPASDHKYLPPQVQANAQSSPFIVYGNRV